MRGAHPTRPYLSARGVQLVQARLAERDRAILRQVAELRLMSARQIQAVHFPAELHGSQSAATRARQRAIARLISERLLIALDRRIGGVRAGSAGLVLALGPVGQRLLSLDGPRRRRHEPGLRFVEHTLAIAQLVVEANLAARAGELELLSCEVEPASWRQFAGLGGAVRLRPDACVALGSGGYELRWFVEIDRATESLPTLERKCQVYADYYQAGVEQAEHGVFPRVLWSVPDENRAARLRWLIARSSSLPERLFVVATSQQTLATLVRVSNTSERREPYART